MFASSRSRVAVVKFPIMPKKRDFVPTNRLREIRKSQKKTLTQVGDALGTTATQIARLEIGDRELTTHWMQRLATVYLCDPADLLLPEHGGLNEQERALIDTLRDLPEHGRAAILSVAESQQPFRHQAEEPGPRLNKRA